MPPAIYTQSTIALIWDFDKTLTHGTCKTRCSRSTALMPLISGAR